MSYAKHIGYCKQPVYYYFQRDDSEVHTKINPRIIETIQAELYGIKNCSEKYREIILYIIAKRIKNNIAVRWIFADKFLEHLKNIWTEISINNKVYTDKTLYKELTKYRILADHQSEKNIFIDGFGQRNVSKEYLEKISSQVFYDGGNCIVLDEVSCNVDELPVLRQAFNEKNYGYVAGYFAAKKIKELGGIYLGRDVIVDLPMNFIRHLNAFFCYQDNFNYTEQIFGGKK